MLHPAALKLPNVCRVGVRCALIDKWCLCKIFNQQHYEDVTCGIHHCIAGGEECASRKKISQWMFHYVNFLVTSSHYAGCMRTINAHWVRQCSFLAVHWMFPRLVWLYEDTPPPPSWHKRASTRSQIELSQPKTKACSKFFCSF